MMKPHIHANNSVKLFGGKASDYIKIHECIDSSKVMLGDIRHRVLTHNTWFIGIILPQIFGSTIINSDGEEVSVIEIGEQHVTEDLGEDVYPTPEQWLKDYELPEFGEPFKSGKRKKPAKVAPPPVTEEPQVEPKIAPDDLWKRYPPKDDFIDRITIVD